MVAVADPLSMAIHSLGDEDQRWCDSGSMRVRDVLNLFRRFQPLSTFSSMVWEGIGFSRHDSSSENVPAGRDVTDSDGFNKYM